MANDTPWYKTAFDDLYVELYAHRDREDARRAVDFLFRQGLVKAGQRVLDLCCGAGRHLEELRERGVEATGLDLSRALLMRARDGVEYRGARPTLAAPPIVQADMKRIPLKSGVFDVVVNLFTSFGYYPGDEENESVFRDVFRALDEPGADGGGGRRDFVIDFLNAPRVERTLEARSEHDLGAGRTLVIRRSIEGEPRRVVKRTRIVCDETRGGGEREIVESVRLFRRDELEGMLTRSGFEVAAAYGDFDGSAHTEGSPRCIIHAVK